MIFVSFYGVSNTNIYILKSLIASQYVFSNMSTYRIPLVGLDLVQGWQWLTDWLTDGKGTPFPCCRLAQNPKPVASSTKMQQQQQQQSLGSPLAKIIRLCIFFFIFNFTVRDCTLDCSVVRVSPERKHGMWPSGLTGQSAVMLLNSN